MDISTKRRAVSCEGPTAELDSEQFFAEISTSYQSDQNWNQRFHLYSAPGLSYVDDEKHFPTSSEEEVSSEGETSLMSMLSANFDDLTVEPDLIAGTRIMSECSENKNTEMHQCPQMLIAAFFSEGSGIIPLTLFPLVDCTTGHYIKTVA